MTTAPAIHRILPVNGPTPILTDCGNARVAHIGRVRGSLRRLVVLLATCVPAIVGLSCKNAVIKHEREWYFEGLNARWRFYADTLPMAVEHQLAHGSPSVRRNAAIYKTFGALCFYDPGSEDQAEMHAGVFARTERQTQDEDARRRLHSAYRTGRKVASRVWWQLYTSAMDDDTTKPWTFDLSDSMKALSADLDFRMHPGKAIDDWRVKRKCDALQAELWRKYLQIRDSSDTKPKRK